MPGVPEGTRFGPYEIIAPLGAGGMGEVYRARDTRLDRLVALKVIHASAANDPRFRERFQREARAISQITHPNICALYDVGEQDGTSFLVMELLEGETWADRLARSRDRNRIDREAVAEALNIAGQVAAALEAAHRKGIVHRDLKPANVMLTRSGAKLLDFGLAKPALSAANDVSLALTSSQPLTTHGTVLGTVHYMAPEQLEGREADARSDIWALGVVIYEAVTGGRPFDGQSPASIIGAILKDKPVPIAERQPLAPAALDHVIERCLAKEPDDRWQNAGDAKHEIAWATRAPRADSTSMVSAPPRRSSVGWIAAGLALLIATMAIVALASRPPSGAAHDERLMFSIIPPPDVHFAGSLAVSPDGRRFVFAGLPREGRASLWIRDLDTNTARRLDGTDDGTFPFWSPGSDAIGFFAGGKLMTIVLESGTTKAVATASNGRGGSWNGDDFILYVPEPNSPVYRVSARGGEVTQVTSIDIEHRQIGHRWPLFIDNRHFVFTGQGPGDTSGIYLGTIDSGPPTRLASIYSNCAYVDGHLLYVSDGMIVAQALDLPNRRLTGEVRQIAGPVAFFGGIGFEAFATSSTGVLTYIASDGTAATTEMRWFDRTGKPLEVVGQDTDLTRFNSYFQQVSPDQKTFVFSAFRSSTADLWLLNIARGVASRFTSGDASEINPVWSPDGTELLFASNASGVYQLFRKAVNAGDQRGVGAEMPNHRFPTDWSRHGDTILYSSVNPTPGGSDIWTAHADGTGASAVLATPFNEYAAHLSPSGQWMAFTSDESGRPEIYVQQFPSGAGRTRISVDGGSEPQWRRDGRELFYLSGNRTLTAVPITDAPSFAAGKPSKLFDQTVDTTIGSFHAMHYAAAADGQRFLLNVSVVSEAPTTVVLNWTEALRR